ncbi:hypothetical protein [Thermoflexibacter ruber]|uniref:Outer membrane protein beta-barrel domain-containing protein n=1 Tax=Thermoflexibacter ruber TaxID=1003 RepID=A0A1I2KAS7_9BACT|nr:hypothetical protein [Thermoflexibacter ruber]SFF63320.1 hypothetical protein SAMN04488541_10963 [Thermoflexibacter ruber]
MMRKVILLFSIVFLAGYVFAQKDKTWNMKLGLYASKIVFENLPSEYSVTVYDSLINPSNMGKIAERGSFDTRLNGSLMIYKEKVLKNWLSALVGVGYRQRGYRSQKGYVTSPTASPNGFIKKDIEVSLRYLSTDIALRFYLYKHWYLLTTGRFDLLVAKKSTQEHEYLANNIKNFDISPSIALGKEIAFKGYALLIEYEVNRSLHNISTLPPAIVNFSATTFRNFTYGFNVGIKF